MHYSFGLRMIVVGFVGLFAGCVTMPDRLGPDVQAKIKKVAVVSLAGHELHRQYVGLTVFGNEEEKHDISTWKVDDEYESQMQSVLTKLARFESVRIPYTRKEFYPIYDINGPWDAPAFRAPKWSAVEMPLKTFAQKNSLDAIVLVIRTESQDFLSRTNQTIRGAGFFVRGMGEDTNISVLHLLALVAINGDSKAMKSADNRGQIRMALT